MDINTETVLPTLYGAPKKLTFSKQLSQDVTLPDFSVDIARIIDASADISISEYGFEDGKAVVSGEADYTVLYLSDKDAMLHKFTFEQEYSTSYDYTGGNAELIKAFVYKKEPVIRLTGARKFTVKLDCEFALYTTERSICPTVDKKENYEILTAEESVTEISTYKAKTVKISEDITLPESYPKIADVILCNINASAPETVLSDGKILISSDAELKFVYLSEDAVYTSYRTTLPLTSVIELEDSADGVKLESDMHIASVKYGCGIDSMGENRVISVDFDVCAETRAYGTKTVGYIKDAYVIGKASELKTEQFTYSRLNKLSKSEITVSASEENTNEEIETILSARASAQIKRSRTESDKLYLEGSCDAVFFAKTSLGGFSAITKNIPFDFTADFPGGEYNATAFVKKVNIENAENGYKFNVQIDVCTEYFSSGTFDAVTDIKETDKNEDDCVRPALLIYYPDKDETLWQIGKTHGVSAEKIKEVNRIDSVNKELGKFILIPNA